MPLPTYTYNRITYTVDYRMQQFRYIPTPTQLREKNTLKEFRFYDFKSPEGDRILAKMIREGVADESKLNL